MLKKENTINQNIMLFLKNRTDGVEKKVFKKIVRPETLMLEYKLSQIKNIKLPKNVIGKYNFIVNR